MLFFAVLTIKAQKYNMYTFPMYISIVESDECNLLKAIIYLGNIEDAEFDPSGIVSPTKRMKIYGERISEEFKEHIQENSSGSWGCFKERYNDWKDTFDEATKSRNDLIDFCKSEGWEVHTSLPVKVNSSISEGDISFSNLEDAPVYPGCSGYAAGLEACFYLYVNRHFKRKLNTDLLLDLGVSPGRKKIYSQIRISKTGKIEIVGIRSSYPRFNEEVERVINLLPRMTPGKQKGYPVNTIYMCEIVIDVTKTSAEVVDYFDL